MSTVARFQLILALLLLGFAAWMFFRHFQSERTGSDLAFFYDLSEKKLFTSQRTNIPPIKGINDGKLDAVRAIVVSTNGHPRDKSSWTIAYLETYSEELKQQMETARASGGSPTMGRGAASFHRLVKGVSDADWVPMNSPQGEQIVNRWLTLGPGGSAATVCTP